jgi:hypothetical protein
MRTFPVVLLLASMAGCVTGRTVRPTDVANLDLLPTGINFLSTPGAVTWTFPNPVHIVVLEQMSRGPAFRVAYAATPEEIDSLGNFGPTQLLASTTTRAPSRGKAGALRPPVPVMRSIENGGQCLSVPVGAGQPEVQLNCAPHYLTGSFKSGAHERVFLRPLMLVVSASPIDTAALVASDRWVRRGVRPPGTTGDWAVMPLALVR